MRGPALFRRNAADHLGVVPEGLLRVEGALCPRHALADHPRVPVDPDVWPGRKGSLAAATKAGQLAKARPARRAAEPKVSRACKGAQCALQYHGDKTVQETGARICAECRRADARQRQVTQRQVAPAVQGGQGEPKGEKRRATRVSGATTGHTRRPVSAPPHLYRRIPTCACCTRRLALHSACPRGPVGHLLGREGRLPEPSGASASQSGRGTADLSPAVAELVSVDARHARHARHAPTAQDRAGSGGVWKGLGRALGPRPGLVCACGRARQGWCAGGPPVRRSRDRGPPPGPQPCRLGSCVRGR